MSDVFTTGAYTIGVTLIALSVSLNLVVLMWHRRLSRSDRKAWFTYGFESGDLMRRYIVARALAKENPAYLSAFEADCAPGGRWEKAHQIMGQVDADLAAQGWTGADIEKAGES